MDGCLWQIPLYRNRHHHPFLPIDMDSQDDSWSKTSIVKVMIMMETEGMMLRGTMEVLTDAKSKEMIYR